MVNVCRARDVSCFPNNLINSEGPALLFCFCRYPADKNDVKIVPSRIQAPTFPFLDRKSNKLPFEVYNLVDLPNSMVFKIQMSYIVIKWSQLIRCLHLHKSSERTSRSSLKFIESTSHSQAISVLALTSCESITSRSKTHTSNNS